MKKRDRIRFVAVFVSLGLLVSLISLGFRVERAAAEVSLNVGYLAVISFAPMFIADEKGFLKEAGIKINYNRFHSGAKMVAPLSIGQLDLGAGSISAGFFNALAQGTDLKIVADKGQARPGYGYSQLVVRKDLIDSGRVKTIKDLKGLRVGFSGPMTIHSFWVGLALQEAGLTLKDINRVFIKFHKLPVALKNKSIDVAGTAEPWGARIEKLGYGVRHFTADMFKASKNLQVAVIMYGGPFIRNQRSVAQNYMNAYVKAVRLWNERGLNDPSILDILVKWTKVPKDVILASRRFYLDNDAMPQVESISAMQDFFAAVGAVKQKVPMSQVFDLSFVKAAAAMN